MYLYKVIYQDRNGNQFTKIFWAISADVALARAKRGMKSNVIISFQELPIERKISG